MKCENCWGSGEKLNHAEMGKLVRLMRERRGEKLTAAAVRLGISGSMLSLLEHGKRKWTEELYQKAIRL